MNSDELIIKERENTKDRPQPKKKNWFLILIISVLIGESFILFLLMVCLLHRMWNGNEGM